MKESEKRLKDDILKRILHLENKLGRIKTQPVKLSEKLGNTIINYTVKAA
jgi:hypothetical protein